jgi:hypothetical protein
MMYELYDHPAEMTGCAAAIGRYFGRMFEAYLDEFFGVIGSGDALILGISDTKPPAADFGWIKRIGDNVEIFGPLRPNQP